MEELKKEQACAEQSPQPTANRPPEKRANRICYIIGCCMAIPAIALNVIGSIFSAFFAASYPSIIAAIFFVLIIYFAPLSSITSIVLISVGIKHHKVAGSLILSAVAATMIVPMILIYSIFVR